MNNQRRLGAMASDMGCNPLEPGFRPHRGFTVGWGLAILGRDRQISGAWTFSFVCLPQQSKKSNHEGTKPRRISRRKASENQALQTLFEKGDIKIHQEANAASG
jgi:hypothetical protein